MSIIFCSHCKTAIEHNGEDGSMSCTKCSHTVKIYNTTAFVNHILKRWFAAEKELKIIKNQESDEDSSHSNLTSSSNNSHTSEQNQNPLHNVRISDTDILSTEKQHSPLLKWFQSMNITPHFDLDAVDMSGYFDEAAESIGKNYSIMSNLIGKIAWSYRKQHSSLNIDLKKFSQKEGQLINSILRTYYSNTFFSRYNYNKRDKNIHLKLQKASPIQQFFNGSWLEWFALGALLKEAQTREKGYIFSCARNVKITFPNEDIHELDCVFLAKDTKPVIIECKTGEFRRDIDKYLTLRKRLNVPPENFIILATELDEVQVKSLNGMYDLTFVSLNGLSTLLKKLL